MFVYYTRKPEDVKLHKEFKVNKKELCEDYNNKRSEYDKTLEKYSNLLKKLDYFPKDSIEGKALVVDLENLSKLLKEDKPKDDVKVIVDDKEEKPKPKRKPPVKKSIPLDLE